MAKGTWKVQSNVINGETMYIPYRLRDTSGIMHSGNIEHYGEYTKDRKEAQAMVDRLNNGTEAEE